MENKQRLLKIRRIKKKKKPAFLRQEWFKKSALGMKWRRPRGRTSKLRIEEGARGKRPGPGYRSPIAVRGLNRAGLMEVRITHMKELDKIDAKTQSVVLAATIGRKKRMEILKKAGEMGLTVSNFKL